MNTRTDLSVQDLTLRARHLRSVYLAGLFRKALSRLVRGIAGQTRAATGQIELALDRR